MKNSICLRKHRLPCAIMAMAAILSSWLLVFSQTVASSTLNEQLVRACLVADVNVCRELLQQGAKADCLCKVSLENGLIAISEDLKEARGMTWTPLLAVVAQSGPVDSDGGRRTVIERVKDELHRLEIVEMLVDDGVEVEKTDEFGMTALVMAVSNGHENVALYLLACGARADVLSGPYSDGPGDNSMLHLCGGLSANILRALIKHGAPLNHRNSDGFAPLDSMYTSDDVCGVAEFLAAGADLPERLRERIHDKKQPLRVTIADRFTVEEELRRRQLIWAMLSSVESNKSEGTTKSR